MQKHYFSPKEPEVVGWCLKMLEFTEVGMQEAYGMALMISFVQNSKGWMERIDGDALWDCLSFVVMLEGGVMHGAK